jgi:hypothetical protein
LKKPTSRRREIRKEVIRRVDKGRKKRERKGNSEIEVIDEVKIIAKIEIIDEIEMIAKIEIVDKIER